MNDITLDELDKLFFEHSAYYKSIDNGEISFFVWAGGAGGDFLLNLFLDNLPRFKEVIKTFKKLDNTSYLKKNRYFPCIDPDFDYGVYDMNGYLNKELDQINTHFKVGDIEELNFSKDIIKKFDNMFYQACLAMVGKKYVIQQQPILPYVYYKNFEKIKIVIIDIESSLEEYVNRLFYIKTKMSPSTRFVNYFDFLSSDKLIKFDYRKLFFEQDDVTIKKLMHFFNSKKLIEYYKYEIEQYHKRNLELVNQDY